MDGVGGRGPNCNVLKRHVSVPPAVWHLSEILVSYNSKRHASIPPLPCLRLLFPLTIIPYVAYIPGTALHLLLTLYIHNGVLSIKSKHLQAIFSYHEALTITYSKGL